MERKKTDRGLIMLILLSTITCGIYAWFFGWYLYRDINEVCSVKEKDDSYMSPNFLLAVIFNVLTCGIYGIYWTYKQGNRIQNAGRRYGIDVDENGTTYLMWSIIGVLLCGLGPLIGQHLFYKNVNKICGAYNRENDGSQQYRQKYEEPVRQERVNPKQEPDKAKYKDAMWSAPESANSQAFTTGKGNGSVSDLRSIGADSTVYMSSGELICIKGVMKGASIPILDREIVTIGRDGAQCNLILDDLDISRKHCTIQFISAENCYYVTDYSSNGITINDNQKLNGASSGACMRGTKLSLGFGSNEFVLQ